MAFAHACPALSLSIPLPPCPASVQVRYHYMAEALARAGYRVVVVEQVRRTARN
jgi:hypothetical protein